ncbi:MupG family TIM beta-alpha barrel fold protein [Niallia sp. 03133]|uniref:MupG family TIM beta-alpha barrel fold protein n=1 Tax=Niallia sp. 03133 TaxID=3458060 RepID=UPI004044C6DF
MIGISFYLNDPSAEERIRDAGKKGVENAFTSLHIPEESGDLVNRAKQLLQIAKNNGIDVYADVSDHTPRHLGLSSLYDLQSLGVVGIRLDDFFEKETVVELSKHFKIALNASILFENQLKALLDRGLDNNQLIAWHNFYPRVETGLDETFFIEQNKLYNKYAIPVCAFVPGKGQKRGPLFNGLPTLEKHRKWDPFHAAVELLHNGVKHIYIGDPEAGENVLEQLIQYEKEAIMPIRIECSYLKEKMYKTRPDAARDVIRLMNTRSKATIDPLHLAPRPKGSITMDNVLYGRYQGEIQITKTDLPLDERVNVIGRVVKEDLHLLDYIKPGQSIHFLLHS